MSRQARLFLLQKLRNASCRTLQKLIINWLQDNACNPFLFEVIRMSQWGFWIVTTVATLVLGMLGYFVKKQIADIAGSITKIQDEHEKARLELTQRVEKLEDKLQDNIESMPYRYTLREDFIRAVTGLDAKLDKILDKVGGSSANGCKD